jgi:hypothetical protein
MINYRSLYSIACAIFPPNEKIAIWKPVRNHDSVCVWRGEANCIPTEYLQSIDWKIFGVEFTDEIEAIQFAKYINILIKD